METPGYRDIVTTLFLYVRDDDHMWPMDPVVVGRHIEYAARRVKESNGTESYAHHFLEAVYSTYGAVQQLTPEDTTIVNGLLECYVTPGAISDVEHVPLELEGQVWDHFKGGIYRTNRLERDADNGKNRVSYFSLIHNSWHSRRAEQWNEIVQWPDGKYRSRFVLRGPEGTPEPPFKVQKA